MAGSWAMRRLVQEVVAQLGSGFPAERLHAQIAIIAKHAHGPYAWLAPSGAPVLVLGIDLGLYALVQAYLNPYETVLFVEEDADNLKLLRTCAERAKLSNVRFLASVARVFDALAQMDSEPLGIVAVGLDCARPDIMRELGGLSSAGYIFGEFDERELNPLWLHEFCRSRWGKFHWYNRTIGTSMVGVGSAAPLLSVVVPIYGVEKYLDRCLSGLTAEAIESCEIIVVDDGAEDESGRIADRWAEADARVQVIHQANAGCAAARRRGMAAARGVYVGFVDGDDWTEPPMFRSLLESAVRYGSEIAQCGYQEFHESLGEFKPINETFRFSHNSGPGSGLMARSLDLMLSRPTIWRRIYRREFLAFHEIDFIAGLPRFDDLPFHVMTTGLAERVSVIEGYFYCYRQQRPGQDIEADDARLFVHFPIFRCLKEFLNQHHTAELERQMKLAQIATHYWGSLRIKATLRDEYLDAAAYDVFNTCLSLSVVDILWITARRGPGLLPWLLKLYQRKSKGFPAWEALQYFQG
jgi:glycosyltransferase involved in cell wall biosynthesis